MSTQKLSTRRNHRGLTRQREAFAQLVARGELPTAASEKVYSELTNHATYGGALMRDSRVQERIEILEKQFQTIAELNRDSLTVEAIETARDARAKEKFSASISGLRLAGDLQGLISSNPVQEATAAFLGFLAGTNTEGSPNIAIEPESELIEE